MTDRDGLLLRVRLANPAPAALALPVGLADSRPSLAWLINGGGVMAAPATVAATARRWRKPVLVTGIAFAVTLAGLGVVLMLTRGAEEAPPMTTATTIPVTTSGAPTTSEAPTTTTQAPTTTAAPTTTTTVPVIPDALGMTWERLAADPVFEDAWITGVTAGGPGLVAVGYVLEAPLPAEWHSDAAVWVSSDGLAWERVDVAASLFPDGGIAASDEFLLDVWADSGGLIAVGYDWPRPAHWTSADGRDWSRVEPPLPGFPGRVLRVGGRLVTVGADGLWHSDDGVNWTRATGDAFRLAEVYDAVAAGPGVIAVGRIGPEDPTSAIWASSDGLDWTLIQEGSAGLQTQFEQVAASPDGTRILAFGVRHTLVSTDGIHWEGADAPFGSPPAGGSEAWDGDRLVVVGRTWGSAAGVWVSNDGGATLYRLDPADPAFVGDTPDISDVVLFGSRFIAVGGDRGSPQQGQIPGGSPMIGAGGQGAVWIGTWDEP